MANCTSCGIQLPDTSWGKSSDLCADCRKMVAQSVVLTPDGTVAPQPVAPRARGLNLRFSVTTVLVGINVAVFVLMALTGISIVEPNSEQLLKWGANWGPLSLGTQPWRILTSNYLHIGIIHIFFNMWCLLNLGALAERVFDRWTYVLVYTASGIAGSLTSLWWHPAVYGAGASGAIFGLAGALLAALYLGKFPIPRAALRGTMKSLVMFAGYNLLFGLVPGIDNSAHIGGLLSGAALGAFFSGHLTAAPEDRARWRTYALVGTGIIFAIVFETLKKQYALPSR